MTKFKKISGWKRSEGFTDAQRLETIFMRIKKMPSGCWEWQGSLDGKGYGQISIGRKPRRAHRITWEMIRGPIPAGKFLLHHCDNRKCCNVEHLYIGDASDNMNDMHRRGRWTPNPRRGEKNNRAKLTADDVRRMRKLHANGVSYAELSRLFKITDVQASNICRRKSWKHIE